MKKVVTLFVISIFLISGISLINAQQLTKEDKNTTFETLNQDDIVSMLQQLDEEMMLGYIENLVEIAVKYDEARFTGTAGCLEAMRYIVQEFSSFGMNVRS